MPRWLTRVRGAIGMGVVWGVAWAGVGLLIGVASVVLPGPAWDAFFRVFDAPLPALAIPGFVGGVLFSGVLGIADRRRSFAQLSLARFALLGLVGGALLSLVPATMVALGLATLGGPGASGVWGLTAVIGAPLTLLSTASATATLALARRGHGERLSTAATSRAALPHPAQAPVRQAPQTMPVRR